MAASSDARAQRAMWVVIFIAYHIVTHLQTTLGLGPILAAMPAFVFMIFSEWVVMRWVGFKSAGAMYTVDGLCSSVSAGIVQQISKVLMSKAILSLGVRMPYEWVYKHYGGLGIGVLEQNETLQKVVAILSSDLAYYWAHRTYHQINLGWVNHAIHHNSDHYNFATALRQSWGNTATSWIFHLPQAFLVSPALFEWSMEWNLIYQFWVHTCLIRRCPEAFEYVFSTPSHHRVHHDRRFHKNFGGIFIIWDRIFGTFLDETEVEEAHQGRPRAELTRLEDGEEVAVFGTMMPQEKYWIDLLQLQHTISMVRNYARSPTMKLKLQHLIKGGGFSSATDKGRVLKRKAVPLERRLRIESTLPVQGGLYVMLHFSAAVVLFILTTVSLDLSKSFLDVCVGYSGVLLCLASLACIHDVKGFAPYAEIARCLWMAYRNLGSEDAPQNARDPKAIAGIFFLASAMAVGLNTDWLAAKKRTYAASKAA